VAGGRPDKPGSAKKTRRRARAAPLFRHILVTTDLTRRTAPALRAASLLWSSGSRITLLHVIETIEGLPFAELAPFYRRLEEKARADMARLARGLRTADAIQCRVLYGHRVERIVKFAASHAVDLVVVPSHRVASIVSREWETMSYRIGILAPCPVLLVK
jgi:nucleotide-binding universal stress UspA family protein